MNRRLAKKVTGEIYRHRYIQRQIRRLLQQRRARGLAIPKPSDREAFRALRDQVLDMAAKRYRARWFRPAAQALRRAGECSLDRCIHVHGTHHAGYVDPVTGRKPGEKAP